MVKINQKIIPISHHGRRPGGKMIATTITVHSNGNDKSTAKNEADNLFNNEPDRQVSFHFAVDDKEAWQSLPIDEPAWHAGDGFDGPGNKTSIAVEICESGDRKKTLLNAVDLFKYLFELTGLGVKDLRPHHFWSGKNCPRILIDPKFVKGGMDWAWFLAQFNKEEDEMVRVIEIEVDGKVKKVEAINKNGSEFIKSRDIAPEMAKTVGYNNVTHRPVFKTK